MSTWTYRLLLQFYPRDFRRKWEEELVETFACQLAESRLDAWFYAFLELFRVALPLQAGSKTILLPFASAACSGTLLFGLIWALGNSIRLLAVYHQLLARLGG